MTYTEEGLRRLSPDSPTVVNWLLECFPEPCQRRTLREAAQGGRIRHDVFESVVDYVTVACPVATVFDYDTAQDHCAEVFDADWGDPLCAIQVWFYEYVEHGDHGRRRDPKAVLLLALDAAEAVAR